ncbi:MAG TPA: hypothetical protein QF517_06805 [Pseudomonadales bacterium]|jgi:predicted protein tyrosine phosphatase|nr:hypothetical protein [Gammaproteobacteria bacterium]MDP6026189.1 hypothetical protein [Pseudomonadales bacterium]MDP6314946.1 hypothetical protein [Pseudomonadales bacterium]MDP7314824.1 hypothetical protein [Pseudomonadales bacterium]MDP7575975.1 hypothetical protein [Pseudomonadales bacterium]|tara:strand:+ start:18743 stop:19486 length:744 start_codon:yes stop_codon:yes gene_type:complete
MESQLRAIAGSTPFTAPSLAREGEVNLVLMDIVMPIMNGVRVKWHLLRCFYAVPIPDFFCNSLRNAVCYDYPTELAQTDQMIYVTSLFQMPHHVRTLAPEYLVSIIQPEFQPLTPPEIRPDRHHRVAVHDISEPAYGSIHLQDHHMADLIGFLQSWPENESLLIHCYAGISRSTAVALIAKTIKSKGSEMDSALALRAAAPYAKPNHLVISLADQQLGLEGRLITARKAMGTGLAADETTLVTLSAE